jgi:sortase A
MNEAKLVEGQTIGRLEIPAIELSAMVAEGVETSTLRRSIGHIPGTSLPGARGNVAISAHRDTFFRNLGKLQRGDLISIATLDGTFDYAVESTSIVDPDERAALRDIGRPTLTLVTCYPFYFVGAAPKRFVVHAGLIAY